MDLLKKHYEKILLGVVLLGLAVAVGFLPIKITSEKQKLTDLSNARRSPKVAPLTNLDLTMPEKELKGMAVTLHGETAVGQWGHFDQPRSHHARERPCV